MSSETFRFHLLGLSHLPTSKLYGGPCAFTAKNVKLAKMLMSLGHEVFLYGAKSSEGAEPDCSAFIETHTIDDIRQDYGSGDNRFEIGYDWRAEMFRHDINAQPKPSTWKFRANAIKEIEARKRPDDFLLITQGMYQKPIGDMVGLFLTCEPGIGYRGSYCRFRAFESSYIQNFTYGSEHPRQSIDGSYWDRVIPNYFEHGDLHFSAEKDDYYLYIGRMISRKGVQTAVKVCNEIGAKLLLAGQGGRVTPDGRLHAEDFTLNPGTWEYLGSVDFEARKPLFARALATFVPTLYLEPFAGTHIESIISGTPVITTDFGVFPATVIHGVNGFRCHMLQDFIDAAHAVKSLDPHAVKATGDRYLCNNVRYEYHKWFTELHRLWESTQDETKPAWHYLRKAKHGSA